jgi:hypothetical protein
MEEILPGFHHWSVFEKRLARRVHSFYVEPAGALIDPTVPEEGLGVFDAFGVRPQQALLTNHTHYRDAGRYRDTFDVLIRVPALGLAHLEDQAGTMKYEFGDEVAYGVTAVEMGQILEEESAFWVSHGEGAVAFGDVLTHPGDGPIGFPPDPDIGAHPDRRRRALKERFRGLLLRDFDALLFDHGEPVPNEGKEHLRRFVEEPVEYPEFGPYE